MRGAATLPVVRFAVVSIRWAQSSAAIAVRSLALCQRLARPDQPAPPQSTVYAERRQLTVMFCDLVGSTALASRLDPEDLRDVIGAYHHCVAETVRRFDGFVAKYMGDGVLVYFGYPAAHEDDAERAVLGRSCSCFRASRASASRASPTALQKRLAGEPHSPLRYFCSPHHQDSALHPTIAQLERAAGLAREVHPRAPSSPSWRHCSLRRSHRMRTWHFSPSCCRSRPPPPTVTRPQTSRPSRKKEQTFEALVAAARDAHASNGRC